MQDCMHNALIIQDLRKNIVEVKFTYQIVKFINFFKFNREFKFWDSDFCDFWRECGN